MSHTGRLAALLTLVVTGTIVSAPAHAQDCDCDHRVELGTMGFDGAAEGVVAGDRICVMAGEREYLRFQHVQGTEANPVTVLNCGGLVTIHNEDRAYALVFEDDSQHFHVTGTGDPAITYGFDISAPATSPYPGIGLWLLGRSTDYEADFMEIHHTGFAGVTAKTDPLCDGSADQGVFVQRNASIHHMYVHDTGGEGFYVGSTQSDGQSITCDGATEIHQPHFLEGIELHDNLVENTGWDGMQVGMAHSGCRVYRNVIRHVGLSREMYQEQGLQIGTYSACEVFANHIEDGPANGIIVLGSGDLLVHSNVIVQFAADGIYANHRDTVPGARYRFAFNTIVDWGGNGITLFGPMLGPSESISNLLVGAAGESVAAGGDVSFTETTDVSFTDRAMAGFVGADDFHLTMGSGAVGAATAVSEVGVDFDGYLRATPPSAGAFEYRDPSVDAGPGGFDAGPPPSGRDGGTAGGDAGDGGAEDGGGCGCRVGAVPRPSSRALVASAVALFVVVRRRRYDDRRRRRR